MDRKPANMFSEIGAREKRQTKTEDNLSKFAKAVLRKESEADDKGRKARSKPKGAEVHDRSWVHLTYGGRDKIESNVEFWLDFARKKLRT